jgi:hypothetical protein
MADLSMTLTKLKVAVSYALGYGSTYPSGSTEQAHVDRVLDRGLGQFYMPGEAGVPDIPLGHKWSFLSPQTTIVLWATTTGTVSGQGVYSSPSTTITATAAKFYTTMVGHSFTFDTSSTDYTITSVGATATASTAADTCVTTACPTIGVRSPQGWSTAVTSVTGRSAGAAPRIFAGVATT